MSHRTIIVPKDKVAEVALDYNEASKDQLIEFQLNDDEMYLLFEEGVFDLVNDVADIIIDAYEDDYVAGKEALEKVLSALEKFNMDTPPRINTLTTRLIELFKEAIARDTGVYFFF